MIRVSGGATLDILTQLLQKKQKPLERELLQGQPRKAWLCDFMDGSKALDQVVLVYYPNPGSYTGEDVGEICFHGNPLLLNRALELLFLAGARPAEKGEFTRRAFLNQKLSLTAAESIHRVIQARSRFELELAQKNVYGKLSELASQIRSRLISLKAECEAEIDFSTEDLTYQSLQERKEHVHKLLSLLQETLERSERAHSIMQHSKVVLYGAPNTGKSSLLNHILGKERAIISDIPGTTRDYLSETLYLDGMPIQLVDTAGVRETQDSIEKQGIHRSKKELESADIRIILLDTSLENHIQKLETEYSSYWQNALVVANKIDIQHSSWKNLLKLLQDKKNIDICELSCKTGEGTPELLQKLKEKLGKAEDSSEYVLLEERNKHHFRVIVQCLKTMLGLMETDTPPEIYIKEIDSALEEIGKVNGRVDTEEILGRIFSKFCVGK